MAGFGLAECQSQPVRLEIAFTLGPRRNWLNLWKPTIEAPVPIGVRLGRADR